MLPDSRQADVVERDKCIGEIEGLFSDHADPWRKEGTIEEFAEKVFSIVERFLSKTPETLSPKSEH